MTSLTPSRSFRRTAATVLIVAAVVMAPGAGAAEDPCATALEQIALAQPQDARESALKGADLAVDEAGRRVCATAWNFANSRVVEAEQAAAEARAALDAGDRGLAAAQAGVALTLDKENETAILVKAEVDSLPAPTRLVDRAGNWASSVEAYLTPLGLLVAMWVLSVLVFWVLGRLLAMGPITGRQRTAVPTQSMLWSGLIVILVGSTGLVWRLSAEKPSAGPDGAPQASEALAFLIVGIAGSILIGVVKAHELRITVGPSADKPADPPLTGRVLALLEQMGNSPTEGLERPYGTDVDGLTGAVSGLALDGAGGVVAKTLAAVGTLISGRTPWQVHVDTADGVTSVAVRRHRRTAGSIVIRENDLKVAGVDGKLPVEPFVAAYVLTVLATHYRGFEGLGGATRWRSVGLQYLASTDYLHKDTEGELLLAEAVHVDPANTPAQIDLAYRRRRNAEQADELLSYGTWLDEQLNDMSDDPYRTWAGPKEGLRALWVRTHLTRAAVAVNRYFALKNEASSSFKTLTDAQNVALAKVAALCVVAYKAGDGMESGSAMGRDSHRAWLDQIRARVAADASAFKGTTLERTIRDLHHQMPPMGILANGDGILGGKPADGRTWDSLPMGPEAHYSWACTFIAPLGAPEDVNRGIEHLKQARVRKRIADWMTKDPQLKDFWNDSKAGKVRTEPTASLLDLAVFKPHAAQLKRCGLTTASAYAGLTTDTLAAFTWADESTRRAMLDAAHLVTDLSTTPLADVALDTVAALIKKDSASLAVLRQLSRQQEKALVLTLADTLRTIKGAPVASGLTQLLSEWLSTYRRFGALHRTPRC